MGIFAYFLFLVPSVLIALCLRACIRRITASWHPADALCWLNTLRAVLRALPWASAFAPTLLMKQGLGVFIPASLFLGGAAYERLFGPRQPFDLEDRHNVRVALTSFFMLWALLAFIFFVQQSVASEKESENERRT